MRPYAQLAVLAALQIGQVESARADDRFEQSMEEALELEQQGRFAEGARVLRAVRHSYPDDYQLHLQLGWLEFQSSNFQEAEASYRRAVAISEGNPVARLGLGWTLLRLTRTGEAAQIFETLLEDETNGASAREGLALARAPQTKEASAAELHPMLWGVFHAYSGHPAKLWAMTMAPSLAVALNGHYAITAAYRLTRWVEEDQSGGFGFRFEAPSHELSYVQHEAYATLSMFDQGFGASVHYGYVHEGSERLGDAHVVGLSLRASPLGDMVLEGSAGLYDDGTVLRAAPSWKVPVHDNIALIPGAAVQRWNGAFHFAAGGTLLLEVGRLSASVGARAGREVRPTYLASSLTYNTDDAIRSAMSASLRIVMAPQMALYLDYEWQRLDASYETTPQKAEAHFAAIGLGASL